MDSKYLPAIALAIVSSLVQLGGVAFYGWPIGNIFALLWVENVIITLIAIKRMAGVPTGPGTTGGGKFSSSFKLLFFCFVHGIFTSVLAFMTGLNLTMAMFGTPLVLLVVRYVVEVVVWYTSGAERPRTLSEAHGFAMRRVIMLHVAILACWALMVAGITEGWWRGFGDTTSTVPLLILAVLLAIKTIAEVHAIRLGPNAPTSWK